MLAEVLSRPDRIAAEASVDASGAKLPCERDEPLHRTGPGRARHERSEEHTSELQSPCNLVCRLLLEKKKIDRLETTDGAVRHPLPHRLREDLMAMNRDQRAAGH